MDRKKLLPYRNFMVHYTYIPRTLAMEALNLSLHAQQYVRLREHLLQAFPALDVETVADTLEGITNLPEMMAAVIRSALVDEALGSGLRARLDAMEERQSRLEVRASKKRELALQAPCARRVLPSSSNQTL